MKEESVLNVLMYLFKYHLQENLVTDDPQTKLVQQLEDAGFERRTIYLAFDWLDQLGEQITTELKPDLSSALRIYSSDEQNKLDTNCRGFLTMLEDYGILRPHTREMVITQALALEEEGIDVHLIKWVTLLVLFTQPDEQDALAFMECLVFNDPTGLIH